MANAIPLPPLRTNTGFRRFWAGRLLANVAQNAILLALLVTVVNRTGSSIHASLLVLSFVLPAALLGVIGGVVVDHLPKRAVLVFSCLLRAILCVIFLHSNESVWIIYATNLALSAITQFSGPAESAVVPRLVHEQQIAGATALLNIGVIIAQVIGSVALAPIFLKTVGPAPLFFVTLVLFLGAAVAFAAVPRLDGQPSAPMGEPEAPRFRGLRASAGESWHLLRSERSVYLSGIQQTLISTTLVVLVSLLPVYTRVVLHLPAENAVYVFTPAAVGVGLGNWLVPRLARGSGKSTLAGLGFLLFVVCLGGLGFTSQVTGFMHQHALLGPLGRLAPGVFYSPAMLAAFMAAPLGFGYAIVLVAARLITYEHVPAQIQGRVFAFQGVLTSLASIVPLVLVGAATGLLGPRAVLVLLAVADLLALLYARTTLPRRRLEPASGSRLPIPRRQVWW